ADPEALHRWSLLLGLVGHPVRLVAPPRRSSAEGGEVLTGHRGHVDRPDGVAVQPLRQRGRLGLEGTTRGGRHLLREYDVDLAVVARAPDPDDAAVRPGGWAAVAVAVEDLVDVVAEVEPAVLPAHRGRVEGREQCHPVPGIAHRVDVV